MNKIFLSILVVILVSTSAYSGEILIASGHDEYPPFMWKEGDKIVGVSAEVTSIIFGELGIKVNSIYIGPWKRLQKSAKTGEIDLVLGIYRMRNVSNISNFPMNHIPQIQLLYLFEKENHFHLLNGKIL